MFAVIKEVKKYPTKPTNKETVWKLEFLTQEIKSIDTITGWIGSGNTMQQVSLAFETFKQASKYAADNSIEYLVQRLSSGGNIEQSKKSYLDIYRKKGG